MKNRDPELEQRAIRNMVVAHNSRAAYCMFMDRGFSNSFVGEGVSAPIQLKPTFCAFREPALANTISANDPN